MEIEYCNKEKALKELREKLKNKELIDYLCEKGLTREEFFEGASMFITLINHWYKKGYQDGHAAAHQNGGEVD